MAFTARGRRSSSITQEREEIEVLIAKILIPELPRAVNMVPAMAGFSRKCGPKTETMATGDRWITFSYPPEGFSWLRILRLSPRSF
jgi:hypothetical protein